MNITQNTSLKQYNTFGIDAKTSQFAIIDSLATLQTVLKHKIKPIMILGGGSNLLLTKDFEGLILLNRIMGKSIERRFKNSVYVGIGGGENWHEFVLWAIKNKLGGVENLSLIPGTVGAAPIQNIGAYGVELKDVFVKLQAVDLKTGLVKTFKATDVNFGYRDSIFKRKYKGRYFIIKVWLKLSLPHAHKINTSYGAIKTILSERKIKSPGIKEISDAVVAIRSSKLPDPKELGNSGSFFKNPEISKTKFKKLVAAYPKVPHYPLDSGRIKVPAGWLIEQCGWKGKKVGNTGAHAKQALVLVNYGKATGKEIEQLAYKIIDSVDQKFGIRLTPEVNIV